MPLKLLAQLDERTTEILRFRAILADSPVHLSRAEAAFRCYEVARGRISVEATRFHELKGVVAGLKLSGPVVLQHQEIERKAIEEGKVPKEVGKPVVERLARAARSILELADVQSTELKVLGGKINGLYVSANDALCEIEAALRHFDAASRDDDEDWSGRGTDSGQRAAATEAAPAGA